MTTSESPPWRPRKCSTPPTAERFSPKRDWCQALEIGYSVDPVAVPGGALLFGLAPPVVESAHLHLVNAVVELPLVVFDDKETAFAVPLPDELDPVPVDFVDAVDAVLGSIDLAQMPPFVGGSLGSGLSIDPG